MSARLSFRLGAGPAGARAGFTLVELIVAVVVLSVGILGFLGTTRLLVSQTTDADLRTERAAARQSVIERLRVVPFDSLVDGSTVEGRFTAQWLVEPVPRAKQVRVVIIGPGYARPGAGGASVPVATLADTTRYRIPRP